MAKRKKCKLCKVKRKEWEERNFFGVKCNKHFVPLIVLCEHRSEINKVEEEVLKNLIKKYYPGWFIDDTISDSDEHWHIHLSRKNRNKK